MSETQRERDRRIEQQSPETRKIMRAVGAESLSDLSTDHVYVLQPDGTVEVSEAAGPAYTFTYSAPGKPPE